MQPEKKPMTDDPCDRSNSNQRPTDAGVETPPDGTYSPDTVQVNRARQQGGGYGAEDMDRQRDPTGADSTEHVADRQTQDVER
jgi:hypothetical protein